MGLDKFLKAVKKETGNQKLIDQNEETFKYTQRKPSKCLVFKELAKKSRDKITF